MRAAPGPAAMSDAELDARVVSSAAEVHDDSGIKRVNQ